MASIKTINSDTLLARQMEQDAFKKEYDALADKYEMAKELIRLRKQANLSQKELAALVGTSQPAISRLESGEYQNLTLSFLRKIGRALGVTPEIHFKKLRHAI